MSKVTLLKGDCLDKLKELKDNSIDSVVTDPPYEIGFMGKGWDDSGIANNPLLWKEVLRVLKPGGHLLSFSHSRTYHRQAFAVEDAGFEIRDQIMWIYGSGFPKSHNIGKALDKNSGNGDLVYEVAEKLKEARESRGITKTQADKLFCNGSTNYSWLEGRKDGVRLPEDDLFQKIVDEWPELKPYQEKVKSANREIVGKYDSDMGGLGGERLGSKGGDITLPSTPIAQQYEGWGTALKPAHEPIVMARKPFKGSVANNVLEWGTGGINIDGCRIGNEPIQVNVDYKDEKQSDMGWGTKKAVTEIKEQGRFPANIIFDEEAGKILDEQSGTKGGNNKGAYTYKDNEYQVEGFINNVKPNSPSNYGDTGGASRFFYCPKASKKDRNEGCDELEEKQTWASQDKRESNSFDIFESDGREKTINRNSHPTVKPTTLMAYLVRLVTPKGGVVLDPFMGSGSTGKASVREGFDFIGIEREDEYMEIAKTRIEHEQKKHNHRKFFE